MEQQEERMTYYEEQEKQWQNYQVQKEAENRRQSLFEGSPDPSTDDRNQEAFAQARQGIGLYAPQELEPMIFHPSQTETVVVEYTIESGKASETRPLSWAHEHGTFDQPLDIERVVFISRDGKRYWLG